MEPKIITKDEFKVIGFELKTTTRDGQNFREIPKFWEKILAEKLIDKIPNKKYPNTSLGICMDFDAMGNFSYIIASEVNSTDPILEGMVSRIIPKATYAVFTAKGNIPKAIQDTIQYIMKEWFPRSNYKKANLPDFELYDERCTGKEDSEVDIYIPIE